METYINNTTEVKCKSCGSTLDAHSTASDGKQRPPQKGDYTVCAYCGTISKFDENGNIIPLTEDELEYMKHNERMLYVEIMNASKLFKLIAAKKN